VSFGGGGNATEGVGGGGTEVTTLADLGQGEGIVSIAVSGDTVYFNTSNAIYVIGAMGGSAAPVVLGGYFSLVADATHLYWSEAGGGAEAGIYAMPLGGMQGSQKLLAQADDVRAIAVDATSVYWPEMGPPASAIMKVPIGGGTPTTLVSLSGNSQPSLIAVDTMNVYWYDMIANTVYSVPVDGNGPIGTLATGQEGLNYSIAAGGGWVYWGTSIPVNGLVQVPSGGGTLKVFDDMLGPERFVVDAFDVYWSDHQGGIKAMPLGGGATRVVSAQSNNSITTGAVSCMAVDQTDVYWGDGFVGLVQKAPKAP
jgi:hypothetical protein